MQRTVFSLVALAITACGGGRDETVAPRGGPIATPSIVAPAAEPGDVIVATVDGRPVWGSCVSRQATTGKSKEQALRECVDFELLAGAANAKQLAEDPLVREATHAALVNRLVEIDFEGRLDAPDTVQPLIDQQLARVAGNMNMPPTRTCTFIRVEVAKGSPQADFDEGKRVADAMYAELDGPGLLTAHMHAAAEKARPTTTKRITVADFGPGRVDMLVPAFGKVLFAIPEVGRASPPTLTAWGWDIILLTAQTDAKVYTREEVAAEMRPEANRVYFKRWLDKVVKQYGTVEIDEAQLATLEGS